MSSEIDVLLIGGRGNIGSGLRTYMPHLDPGYRMTSVDLPGAPDKAREQGLQTDFIKMDIAAQPEALTELVQGRDLVVYLARKGGLAQMNAMTDRVYQAVLAQPQPPMIIGSSSVHAVDGLYNFRDYPAYSAMAERQFDQIDQLPEPIAATIAAHPNNDYGREKAHVEEWGRRLAAQGHSAVALRWGGINAANQVREISERGYFCVWCHQEDAARLVHACYRAHRNGTLPSGAHYFAVSANTYNIFDIEIPRRQIGYDPVHNSEDYF